MGTGKVIITHGKPREGASADRIFRLVKEKLQLAGLDISTFSAHTLHKKMRFSTKDFFSKCDQIRSFLRIWSHLLKKSLMKDFIFCAVIAVALHLLAKQKLCANQLKKFYPGLVGPKNTYLKSL